MTLPVRSWTTVALLLLASTRGLADVQRVDVDHAYVVAAAQRLAAEPYQPRPVNLPPFLRDLSYDDYQRIRFIGEHSLWRGNELPFRVQFFHPGNLFHNTVKIHEFASGFSQRIPFVRTYYDYQDLKVPGRLPGSLEYAGFRVLYPLNDPKKFDEVISFLGASYFRALGRGHRYGISARGLALNYGTAQPEEFPDFVEFWLGKPEPDARELTIHALLDSPSVAGAYTFVLTPGDDTVVHTRATLFFRQQVEVVGLAPLTSMFWFGENTAMRFGDFRPEVHDSDGLLVATGADARLWRPLENPRAIRVTTFPCSGGFGLLQRDRRYYNYEDAEARYERRPGVWIRPDGEWPAGHVRLLEMPTANEYADNVVAAYVLEEPPAAGSSLEYSYEQLWTSRPTFGGPPAWVRSTRRTVQVDRNPRHTRFIIDYAPAGMAGVPADAAVTAHIEASPPASVATHTLFRNEVDGSWRLSLELTAPSGTPNAEQSNNPPSAPPPPPPMEVRVQLRLNDKPLSETWTSTWEP